MLVKLAPYASPAAPLFLSAKLLHELYRDVRYAEHRNKRLQQLRDIGTAVRDAKAVAEAVVELARDIEAHPTLYLARTRRGGHLLGEEMAVYLGAVVAGTAAEIGLFAGRIVGRVVFEIIITIATEGIGTAARGVRAGLEGEEIVGRLAPRLMGKLEGIPFARSTFVKLAFGKAEVATEEVMARWAERGRLLPPLPRVARGGRTNAVGHLWREGSPQLQEFCWRSGERGRPPTTLTDFELRDPPRHVLNPHIETENRGIPHLPPEEREAWLQAHRAEGEHPGSREFDAEAKMFDEVAANTSVDTVGEFHFKANHPPCPVCKDMIFRFRALRPRIRVIQH
jgi:hypothetical protein